MKSASLTALLLLSLGCAHAPAEHGPRREMLRLGDALFELHHDAAEAAEAQQVKRALTKALPLAQRWGTLQAPVVITIHPTHQGLERAAHRNGHPWLRAWARPGSVDLQSPRTWSRGEATDAEMAQILTHELTHCVMYQAVRGPRLGGEVPLWFREGMASVTAGDRHPLMTTELLSGIRGGPAAEPSRAIDPLTQAALLYQTQPALVYGAADRAFRFLLARHGEARIRRILRHVRDGEPFAAAFQEAIGVSMDAFEAEFRSEIVLEETRGQLLPPAGPPPAL